MKLNDKDWELANAYHDGEMRPEDARDFEARLRGEPALRAELDRVKAVSRSLAALRPPSAEAPASRDPKRGFSTWLAAGAVAASFLLSALLLWPDETEGPHAIHKRFMDQSFSVSTGTLHRVAAPTGFPDLAAARLTYVASQMTEIGLAAHYSGQNGCRLTFFTLDGPVELPPGSDMQILQWSVEERQFAILASGMDPGKFSAIAEYLQHETRRALEQETVVALRNATENAASCA